ncbi:MAG: hypothetical protein E7655_03315 [Ruminococcaceae bacterium]|nr:hypothetical protein [Oscillospiraceae bacterium]
MKKFAKFLIPMLALILVAAFCAIPMSAADDVIFVADGGTGDGSSADSPMGNGPGYATWSIEAYQEHSLNMAIAKLAENGKGGTIVICGPVTVNYGRQKESDAKGASDFRLQPQYTEPADKVADTFSHLNYTFTSVYNGVDYRTTNNAAVIMERTAAQCLCMEVRVGSTWENITYRVNNTADRNQTLGNNIFSCFNQKTVIGEGFVVEAFVEGEKKEPTTENALYFPSLSAGSRYANLTGDTDLVVKSGTWNHISGSSFGFGGTSNTNGKLEGNAKFEFGGTAVALGGIHGGSGQTGGSLSGNCETIISGGTINGTVNIAGAGGFIGTESSAKMTITGGDFTGVDSINDYGVGLANNPPKFTMLDLSGLTVEAAQTVYNLVSYVDEIVTPDGFAPATSAPETTTAAPETTTAAPETTPAPETTAAPEKDDETTAPAPSAPSAPKAEGGNTGLIIGIVVAVVVVIAVVAVIVLKKKKA